MADTTTNANSNSANASSNASTTTTSSSTTVVTNTSSNNEFIADAPDCDGEGSCNKKNNDPGTMYIDDDDVMIVSIDRCDLSAANYHTLAEQTASKFKAAFPNNKILVIPSTTTFTIVRDGGSK